VRHRVLALSLALAAPILAALPSCSILPGYSSKKNDSLSRVDQLLTNVERVQAEAVLAKERSAAAFEALKGVVAPDFRGDPVTSYAKLVETIELSKKQQQKLESAIAQLKPNADTVFRDWAESLQSMGNIKLRRASQTRLVETRARYDAVASTAINAQIAYEAFNSDLKDHAVFLEHDFNAAAVAAIADDVSSLDEESEDLGDRLESCIGASKAYVEHAALRGQLAVNAAEVKPHANADDEPAAPTIAERRRRRAAAAAERAAQAEEEAAPVEPETNVAKGGANGSR